jgi:hypothetical protein
LVPMKRAITLSKAFATSMKDSPFPEYDSKT